MKIGLYFGSFNPIHVGHLIIANQVLNETDIQKIWFVVSPQNPLKKSGALLDANKRFALVKKSIAGDKRFFASNIEFFLSKPSFTISTLQYLKENYLEHTFSIIMGSDSFQHFSEWKNFKEIIHSYKILIYPRLGIKVRNRVKAEIIILNAPQLDISSSKIRELIKKEKSIRYLVPDAVRKEIEKNRYYKK
jgi:nicotinate-nucleotide adenylyltransferase